MAIFYHCAPIMLRIGSIIEPGNWGRILRLYQPNFGNPPMAFRERVLEDIRLSEYPEKPSRLSSCFVCPNKESALRYRQHMNHTQLIYEVEPVEENYRIHHGDWRFGYEPNQLYVFDGMAQIARDYWRGQEICFPEVVLSSAIRITGRVEQGPEMLP